MDAAQQSRKRKNQVYVLFDKDLRDKLKLVAMMSKTNFFELLKDLTEEHIAAWEKTTGMRLDLVAKRSAGAQADAAAKKNARKRTPAKP